MEYKVGAGCVTAGGTAPHSSKCYSDVADGECPTGES